MTQGPPGSELRLQPVSPADAEELAALHATCFADAWPAPAILGVLAMPGAFGLRVGAPCGPTAGFVLARVASDEAELLTVAVAVPWRRRGLARALIGMVAAEARLRGAARLFLEVAEDNAAARDLYAGEGFATVGRRRGYYARPGAPAIDALTMRRDLPAILPEG